MTFKFIKQPQKHNGQITGLKMLLYLKSYILVMNNLISPFLEMIV